MGEGHYCIQFAEHRRHASLSTAGTPVYAPCLSASWYVLHGSLTHAAAAACEYRRHVEGLSLALGIVTSPLNAEAAACSRSTKIMCLDGYVQPTNGVLFSATVSPARESARRAPD